MESEKGNDLDNKQLSEEIRQYLLHSCQLIIEDLKDPSPFGGFDKIFPIIKLSDMLDRLCCWHEWLREIPYLKFPADWEVKVVPPFSGAVVRFWVKKGHHQVSVYLDCYDIIGWMRQPYWEIYPYEGDTYRVYMNDIDELIEYIGKALEHPSSKKLNKENI